MRLVKIFAATAAVGSLLAAASSANAVPYTFTPIDVPGAIATAAYGTNNAGQIVGIAGSGGFLATPIAAVPEPSSLALLGVGLISLAAIGWQKSR